MGIYPGTIYAPWETLFFVSLRNHYIIRLADGWYIDGKRSSLSKNMYLGVHSRDRLDGRYEPCDTSWLKTNLDEADPSTWSSYMHSLRNPLSIGQVVNDAPVNSQPNVSYEEIGFDSGEIPLEFHGLLPNAYYGGLEEMTIERRRMVVLISLRSITPGEELFSTYIP